MANNQLQNVNSKSLTDSLLNEKFNALPPETQNQLAQYAAQKKIDMEAQIVKENFQTRIADIDCQRHIETFAQQQRDCLNNKGSSRITPDIKTATGNMRIESKTAGAGCLLPLLGMILLFTMIIF